MPSSGVGFLFWGGGGAPARHGWRGGCRRDLTCGGSITQESALGGAPGSPRMELFSERQLLHVCGGEGCMKEAPPTSTPTPLHARLDAALHASTTPQGIGGDAAPPHLLRFAASAPPRLVRQRRPTAATACSSSAAVRRRPASTSDGQLCDLHTAPFHAAGPLKSLSLHARTPPPGGVRLPGPASLHDSLAHPRLLAKSLNAQRRFPGSNARGLRCMRVATLHYGPSKASI